MGVNMLQLTVVLADQSIWVLCSFSQGRQCTKDEVGEGIT